MSTISLPSRPAIRLRAIARPRPELAALLILAAGLNLWALRRGGAAQAFVHFSRHGVEKCTKPAKPAGGPRPSRSPRAWLPGGARLPARARAAAQRLRPAPPLLPLFEGDGGG